MNRELIIELASRGCMAYDDYDLEGLLEKAEVCEQEGIKPEKILNIANRCCGVYEFYNPVRLLRKAVECSRIGHDPEAVLEKALKECYIDQQPVRVLSEMLDDEGSPRR